MLRVEKVTYAAGSSVILRDIGFTLGDNDKAGLVGVNGAGKTTLMRIIAGKTKPDQGKISIDSVRIGYMPQTLKEMKLRDDMTVFEFLESGRPLPTLFEQQQDIYSNLGVDSGKKLDKLLNKLEKLEAEIESWGGYEAENDLLRIMVGMNLGGINLESPLSSLSGGQKSKVAFARTLYSGADVLLLDEPTNHLDAQSRQWAMTFLSEFNGAVLVISHDSEFLDSFVSKIIRLDEFKRTAELYQGSYSDYLKQWEVKYKTQEREVHAQEREEQKLQDLVDKFRNVSGKRKRMAQSREKQLEKLRRNKKEKIRTSQQARIIVSPRRESSQTPVALDKLCFGYESDKPIIKNLSFTLSRNEKFVVLGKNGAGKTTLLKLIAGKLDPDSGKIIFGPKTDLGYYDQEQESLNMDKNVLDEAGSVSNLSQARLRAVLSSFLFAGEKVHQKVSTLSPGERSRLAMAKLALEGDNLLLLDEPTNHLDAITRESVAHTLDQYGGTIIVVSHDTDFLEKLGVNRMLIMPSGDIEWYNPATVKLYREE